jgi:peptide/nickel transport system substrate-binding protein
VKRSRSTAPIGFSRRAARRLAGALATAVAANVVVAATPLEARAAEEPTTLTIGVVDPTVDSLNPFTSIYALPTQVHRLMYDYLTMYSAEDATPTEGLAESWEHSEDGLTWTYTIRDDSTFSDGEPVTAEDVAFTYNTIMEDDSGAMANANFVENFESVTAVDETTVEIRLKRPSAIMLALDIPIVPQHVWEGVDDIGEFSNEDQYPIVGNGPWILTDYQRNESITLEANPPSPARRTRRTPTCATRSTTGCTPSRRPSWTRTLGPRSSRTCSSGCTSSAWSSSSATPTCWRPTEPT